MFHVSPCKVFKYFYIAYLKQRHAQEFPNLISYNRFVQLMPRLFVPLRVLLQSLFGEETGIYIADPTALPVCTTSASIEIVFLRDLQREEKRRWDGFMVLSCI
ncbi:MAG: hypothetical protein JSR85_02370 [Proteobacteria bacterium]|nr:hypothetical protein [Pseudomonadota bacterium]